MIHVDRSRVEPPPHLVQQGKGGVKETRTALKFYSVAANRQEKFKFKAYRNPNVKDLLIRLFHGKCAYCEGSVSGGHDGDVEHFRPKGAVEIEGRSSKPGYYWLAAAWDNLYLSCMHCNQKRKHRSDDGPVLTAGKASKFPVADENGRITDAALPNDLVDANGDLQLRQLVKVCQDEERLLLDPCLDEPAQSLVFLDDGMVIATVDDQGDPDARGDASIRTFGLHRPQLVIDRANALVTIKEQIEFVAFLVEGLKQEPENQLALLAFEKALENLETHCRPEQRFSGMARQVIDRFREEILG